MTPLHIAVYFARNTRTINILLDYLAKLDYSQFDTFKDIMCELINYNSFNNYLFEQTFQTESM